MYTAAKKCYPWQEVILRPIVSCMILVLALQNQYHFLHRSLNSNNFLSNLHLNFTLGKTILNNLNLPIPNKLLCSYSEQFYLDYDYNCVTGQDKKLRIISKQSCIYLAFFKACQVRFHWFSIIQLQSNVYL